MESRDSIKNKNRSKGIKLGVIVKWRRNLMALLELILPYPPSINNYWRHMVRIVHGKVIQKIYITKEGKAFRQAVQRKIFAQNVKPLTENNLRAEISLYPPDNRKRDIDNPVKALLDALQHAGAFLDDAQITKLSVEKCEVKKPEGETVIRLQSG